MLSTITSGGGDRSRDVGRRELVVAEASGSGAEALVGEEEESEPCENSGPEDASDAEQEKLDKKV